MDLFTRDDVSALLRNPGKPCVSLFMPTHRGGAEADPIRWRVHLGEAEEHLAVSGLRTAEVRALLQPTRRLLEDPLFWKHQCDGLAFFLAPEFLRLYRLPLTFTDLVVVGERFHITPLLPLLTGNGRFYVLALSQNGVRLLQGTRDSVSEVDLTGVPRSLAEALMTHDRDEPLTFHTRPAGGLGSWAAIFNGHGVGIDDAKDDLLRYFQQVDRGLHRILRQEQAPLVLASVEYFQPLYRQANRYPHLLEKGIATSPDRLSATELHDRAWALVQPRFQAAQEKAVAQYRQLAGTGRTASDLHEVVAAASRGEIETLFVSLRDSRWGRFDPLIGRVEEHEQHEAGDEDMLNLAAVEALRHGKSVYALGPKQMPQGAALAAIYCLPLARHGKGP